MSLTKQQIVNRVAETAGIIEVGGTLESQYDILIENAYDEVYAHLKQKGLAIWRLDGSVPSELVNPVINLIAFQISEVLEISAEKYNRITQKALLAIPAIKERVYPEYEPQDAPTNY